MTGPGERPRRARPAIALAALVLAAGFAALGTWQIERRAWKHELIARVEQRVHAAPVAAPGRADWPAVSAARDEYRRVGISGHFVPDHDTLVHASTGLGPGYWVLTPVQTREGALVLVNRGFVPAGSRVRAPDAGAGNPVTVTGLLRITEPGGGFLRSNVPEQRRWYSRDVQAIAVAQGLKDVAPYFIDADAVPGVAAGAVSDGGTAPVGGLTVIVFDDNHLVYALTWFTMAALVVFVAGRGLAA